MLSKNRLSCVMTESPRIRSETIDSIFINPKEVQEVEQNSQFQRMRELFHVIHFTQPLNHHIFAMFLTPSVVCVMRLRDQIHEQEA